MRPEPAPTAGLPLKDRVESFLTERKIGEGADLVWLAVSTLHALDHRRFRRVDHWEVVPGGWLPPPEFASARKNGGGTVGQLLDALQSAEQPSIAKARTFAVRMSDMRGNRADVVVRRVHRQRGHALSIDLWGSWTKETVSELTGSFATRLPVARTTLTKYQYAF